MTKLNMRMSTLLKKFTKDHEWVLINESKNEAEIGITNFASNQLG
jgi:glycine cleavage system H lipoate-binding protein